MAQYKERGAMKTVLVATQSGDFRVPVYYDKRLDCIDDEAEAVLCLAGTKRMLGKVRRVKINATANKLSTWALQGLIRSKEAEMALGMYIWGGGLRALPVNLYRLLKKAVRWRRLDDVSYLFGGVRYLQYLRESDPKNAEKRIARLMEQENSVNIWTLFFDRYLKIIPWIVLGIMLVGRMA